MTGMKPIGIVWNPWNRKNRCPKKERGRCWRPPQAHRSNPAEGPETRESGCRFRKWPQGRVPGKKTPAGSSHLADGRTPRCCPLCDQPAPYRSAARIPAPQSDTSRFGSEVCRIGLPSPMCVRCGATGEGGGVTRIAVRNRGVRSLSFRGGPALPSPVSAGGRAFWGGFGEDA